LVGPSLTTFMQIVPFTSCQVRLSDRTLTGRRARRQAEYCGEKWSLMRAKMRVFRRYSVGLRRGAEGGGDICPETTDLRVGSSSLSGRANKHLMLHVYF